MTLRQINVLISGTIHFSGNKTRLVLILPSSKLSNHSASNVPLPTHSQTHALSKRQTNKTKRTTLHARVQSPLQSHTPTPLTDQLVSATKEAYALFQSRSRYPFTLHMLGFTRSCCIPVMDRMSEMADLYKKSCHFEKKKERASKVMNSVAVREEAANRTMMHFAVECR
ncbi:hypothetical protein BaRGS_00015868 [Batillaria attramentaria]|uniref:Uncharacterized protein n=1 Tax=Batillaria attramentaria TaxID=370345 RepID=A0ABD0L0Z9_9CAEN